MKKQNYVAIIWCLVLIFFSLNIKAQEKRSENEQVAGNTTTFEKDKRDSKKEPVEKETVIGSKVKKELSEILPDDSFFVENANNISAGNLHTVNACTVFRSPTKDVACSITQEVAIKDGKHLFSYSMPLSFIDSNQVKGVGDIALTYRRQLTDENSWAVVSPRFTLLIPTGSYGKGLGSGSTGFQFNLPVTKRLSESFVANFNAGATFMPKAKGEDSSGNSLRRALMSYNLGGSIVWAAHKNFNPLIEYVENFASEINEEGRVARFKEHVVSPGVCFAWELKNIKVSPGVAVPVSISQGDVRTGVFFYLAFEHSFFKRIL